MHLHVKINPLYAVVSWVEGETQQLAFNFGIKGAKPNLHILNPSVLISLSRIGVQHRNL